MPNLIIDGCQLEIDEGRGVIYIHHPDGFTALRICGIPTGKAPHPSPSLMLDITLRFQTLATHTFNWPSPQEAPDAR